MGGVIYCPAYRARMAEGEYKMVIAVRADLKLSKGKTAAQAAHAAVNCAFASKKKDPAAFDGWYSSGQRKVVVKVADQKELFDVKMAAEAHGIVCSVITDAGRTEIPAGTITCLGVGPGKEQDIDKVTGNLSML